MRLIRVLPLDPSGPTLLSVAHIEGARPAQQHDGRDGFLLFVGGRATAWISERTMTRLRAGQPCSGEEQCKPSL